MLQQCVAHLAHGTGGVIPQILQLAANYSLKN